MMLLLLAACNNDDSDNKLGDGKIPNLPVPEYELSSAKYDISSTSSKYASIELTGSGNYIIIPRSGYYDLKNTTQARNTSGLPSPVKISTRAENGVIAGKFIKLSDTEFLLEGFGSIVIEGSQSNAYSLQVTPTGGETTTVAATKASTLDSSPITDAICRTWDINTVGGYFKFSGKVLFNKTMPIKDYDLFWESFYAAADDDYDDDYEPYGYYPTQTIFTKAGTYMVFYSNDRLAISTWRWKNEDKGVLVYAWSYDPDDFTESNLVTASFSGTQLLLKEEPQIDEDEDIPANSEAWWLYTMTEMK